MVDGVTMRKRHNPPRAKPLGRRPVAGVRRAARIDVRVTPAEKVEAEDRAAAAGLTVSDFARWKLLGHRPTK